MSKKKIRSYEYKCKRCGKIFCDEIGYPAEMVRWHIQIIGIPDENEERALKEEYPDDYYSDMHLTDYHDCKDGGYGIGELIGCGEEWVVDTETGREVKGE